MLVSRRNDDVAGDGRVLAQPPLSRTLWWEGALVLQTLLIPTIVLLEFWVSAPRSSEPVRRQLPHLLGMVSSSPGMLAIGVTQCLLELPTLFWACHAWGLPVRAALGLVPPRAKSWQRSLLGLALSLLIEWLLLVRFHNPSPLLQTAAGGPGAALLIVPFVFLMPVREELLFRGFLHAAWSGSRLPAFWVEVLISLLFCALHVAMNTALTVVLLFVFSMLLGWSRRISGSLWPPIVLHILNSPA
jgi:membrane protease YdiL (CAAX protease family)